ncbi:unnamed protein product [Adineta ricciae]|uniref:G-protein coupled receptors family 1 profile domain-containing protein n=1 Tax=Adineta ricciae TaxID=249248 RepID=A0A815HE59_ADIRI|nr:unnamed protein product [Adineta ricciae]CAF1462551.1 unnamed protein product [Adineta ricciae]
MSLSPEFWISRTANILSLITASFALSILLFDRSLRHALHNHIIIVLLSVVFVRSALNLFYNIYINILADLAWNPILYYLIWFFIDYALHTTQIILVVWAAIEQHILIFHDQWLRMRSKRFLLHYLPVIILLTYSLIFFSVITFAPFCQNSADDILAGITTNPCSLDNEMLGSWELICHHIVGICIIVLSSLTLIVRIIRQKQRLHRSIQWRKHRKLTIQMLLTSMFYLVCDTPWVTIVFALRYGLSYYIVAIPLTNAFMLRDYVTHMYPFISILSSSDLRHKLRRMVLCWRKRQAILPDGTILLAVTRRRQTATN